jgi:benzaldehyde dehydrogenase (NAD)
MTSTSLLTPTHVWSEKIYSNGWKHPGLGTEDVTEKATGVELGTIGIASAEDITAAAASAREALKAWAKLAGPQRGDVLREAARLVLAHAYELAERHCQVTESETARRQE